MDNKIEKLYFCIEEDLKNNNLKEKERLKISQDLKDYGNRIVIAQTNPISEDIKGNAIKAFQWIKWAEKLNSTAIIFPELFLMGTPIGDYITKFTIVVEENIEWLKAIASKTKDTKVIIGFVDKTTDNNKVNYYNAIGILSEGKVEKIIHKSVLSKSSENNEYRYFKPDDFNLQSRITKIKDKKVLITISDTAFENISLLKELPPGEKPDYIINCSSSISRLGKEELKHKRMQQFAIENNIPVIYVNQTGAGDYCSFDGASRLYDKNGKIKALAKSYSEDFFVINPAKCEGKINPLPTENTCQNKQKKFSLDYENDLERTYLTIKQSIKDYFQKTGFKRAVLGLSGGLDSTVNAVILADTLGAENVLGVSMPSKLTSKESKNDAEILAKNLGIKFTEVTIKEMFDTTREKFDTLFFDVEKHWTCRYQKSFTNDNIQARSRAVILWGIANEFEACLPIATSDKSELYMGYATINGDMSGGFAPLADVTKTKLFALAKWINKNRKVKNAIPNSIIEKRPGAELAINPQTNKPLLAEEALMPYEFLDEIIWRVENLNQSAKDMLNEKFIFEEKENISQSQKEEWIEKFFKKMSTAIFKGSIMPVFPLVDTKSINKVEYHHPITASKINYFKTTLKEKISMLN